MDAPQKPRRPTTRFRPPSQTLHDTVQPLLPWCGEDGRLQDKEIAPGESTGESVDGKGFPGFVHRLSTAETAAVAMSVAHPGMPASHVAESIGSAPNGGIARRLGTNGDLRQHVRALLTEAGFDDKAIVGKWAQLATAKRTEFFSYQGQVLDQREVEALDIQVKGVDALTRLARLYPVTDEEAAARGAGPPALVLQLNLVPPALVDASVLTVALGAPIDDRGVLDASTGDDQP